MSQIYLDDDFDAYKIGSAFMMYFEIVMKH